jgi:hypothetical protein
MADFWTWIAALACGVTFFRIVTWTHKGERYRLDMSLGAYALALCTGCHVLSLGLSMLTGRPVVPVSPWVSLILVWLAALVVLAQGNVARILQLNWGSPWNGIDRRRR